MTNREEVLSWRGRDVVGQSGDALGTLEAVYEDADSGELQWAAVAPQAADSKVSLVPLEGARLDGDRVGLSHAGDLVTKAPRIDEGADLSSAQEAALIRHYRQDSGGSNRQDEVEREDEAMTRSEEELRVGKTVEEKGRARLVKTVETEQATLTVPVQKERVRIETEPITEENRDADHAVPELKSEEQEIVLHEEEVVVEKRVVPKERVRLEKDTVVEEAEVSEDLRKERIETQRIEPIET